MGEIIVNGERREKRDKRKEVRGKQDQTVAKRRNSTSPLRTGEGAQEV
jgi:hypothetical protein